LKHENRASIENTRQALRRQGIQQWFDGVACRARQSTRQRTRAAGVLGTGL